jgi:enamine deaminase RidA (YjgF/YER057c/UK114 family)
MASPIGLHWTAERISALDTVGTEDDRQHTLEWQGRAVENRGSDALEPACRRVAEPRYAGRVTRGVRYRSAASLRRAQYMSMQSTPYGTGDGRNAMGIPVAFCSAIAIDFTEIRRLIWVSGQIAVDEQNQLVGTGDVRAQTEQCLANVERNLRELGGTIDDIVQVTSSSETYQTSRRFTKCDCATSRNRSQPARWSPSAPSCIQMR